jgi:hypothetical protein
VKKADCSRPQSMAIDRQYAVAGAAGAPPWLPRPRPRRRQPPEAPAAGEPVKNVLVGNAADAAPPGPAGFVYPHNGWQTFTTVDFFEACINVPAHFRRLDVRFAGAADKNFKPNPAATEWSADDSGLVWTFQADPNLMWSDDASQPTTMSPPSVWGRPDTRWDFPQEVMRESATPARGRCSAGRGDRRGRWTPTRLSH